MKITILGCGSSTGVPLIGCKCAVCKSDHPKNKRLRASIAVEIQDKTLLFDTSPDLRQQALAHNVIDVDAIIFTHAHADHIHGIDDIRSYNYRKDAPIPIYADKLTLERLKSQFSYVFLPRPSPIWFRPCVNPYEIEAGKPFHIDHISILPILQTHGKTHSLGFRIGNFAYSTDVNYLNEEAFRQLHGIDTWIIDCLRHTDSYTHSKLDMTLQWIERLKPKRAILTHMAHELDYETLVNELPEGVEPGYDGMVIECQ